MADKCDILLIDGKNLLFRVGHTFRDLTAHMSDGTEIAIGAVYGFLKVLSSIHDHWGGIPIICWEGSSEDGFRRKIYSGYKLKDHANLESEFWVESVRTQLTRVQNFLGILGVKQVHSPGYEADDVMATLAWFWAGKGELTGVYTNDADLIQIVREGVLLIQPKKEGEEVLSVDSIKANMGIDPIQYFDLKSLTGCNSDLVPGVPGIGPKRGLELIQTYGSVDKVVEVAKAQQLEKKFKKLEPKIVENISTIEQAKKLVRIQCDAPLVWIKIKPDVLRAQKLIIQWGLKSFRTPNAFTQLLDLGMR